MSIGKTASPIGLAAALQKAKASKQWSRESQRAIDTVTSALTSNRWLSDAEYKNLITFLAKDDQFETQKIISAVKDSLPAEKAAEWQQWLDAQRTSLDGVYYLDSTVSYRNAASLNKLIRGTPLTNAEAKALLYDTPAMIAFEHLTGTDFRDTAHENDWDEERKISEIRAAVLSRGLRGRTTLATRRKSFELSDRPNTAAPVSGTAAVQAEAAAAAQTQRQAATVSQPVDLSPELTARIEKTRAAGGGFIRNGKTPKTVTRRDARIISGLARSQGLVVRFGETGPYSRGFIANGVVVLNPASKDPVLDTFVHEVAHYLEKGAPGEYAAFLDAVVEILYDETLEGETRAKVLELRELYEEYLGQKLDAQGVRSELGAEFAAWVLKQKPGVLEQLARKHYTPMQKLAAAMRKVWQTFQSWITSKERADAQIPETSARRFMGIDMRSVTTEQIETALMHLQRALEKNAENVAAGKRTLDKRGDVRYNRITTEKGDFASRDSEGQSISPEQAETLKGTAIVDEAGRPIAVYHFTPEMSFTEFAKGDIGFHFGTREQAKRRGAGLEAEAGRIFRAYLNIKNPVRINADIMSWIPRGTADKLWSMDILTDAEKTAVHTLCDRFDGTPGYNDSPTVYLRELLEQKGYDGIVYPNFYEGDAESYIAFHDSQIIKTNIENISLGGKNDAKRETSEAASARRSYATVSGTRTAEADRAEREAEAGVHGKGHERERSGENHEDSENRVSQLEDTPVQHSLDRRAIAAEKAAEAAERREARIARGIETAERRVYQSAEEFAGNFARFLGVSRRVPRLEAKSREVLDAIRENKLTAELKESLFAELYRIGLQASVREANALKELKQEIQQHRFYVSEQTRKACKNYASCFRLLYELNTW